MAGSSTPSAMADFDITAAMASIPSKLSDLRKSFEVLTSCPSFSSSSSLQWQQIENHFTRIQNYIQIRLRNLQHSQSRPKALLKLSSTDQTNLKSFCINSDGAALFSFCIRRGRKWLINRRELQAVIHLAPDPATLALRFLDGYRRWALEYVKFFQLHWTSGAACDVLEHVSVSGAEIGFGIREEAKNFSKEWIESFGNGGGTGHEAVVFCRFLLVFGLVAEFAKEEVLSVFSRILEFKEGDKFSKGASDLNFFQRMLKGAADLWISLGLGLNVSDLVESLKTHGRYLEAIKLVCTLSLCDEYPIASILEEYLKNCKLTAGETLSKRKNSLHLQERAITEELDAARSVIEAIEGCKLESTYACEVLKERVKQLEQLCETLKKQAAAAHSSGPFSDPEQLHQQQKRPRLDDVPTDAPK